ncbi:hypothetical protein KSP40_PGU003672 [Platanthera guangdongensis]|uniref:Uncharacterized protein n=1 Tax=Platanthera guangdongensis TaxID=2320717 RepID=A0ABR2MPW5_9ASPA
MYTLEAIFSSRPEISMPFLLPSSTLLQSSSTLRRVFVGSFSITVCLITRQDAVPAGLNRRNAVWEASGSST